MSTAKNESDSRSGSTSFGSTFVDPAQVPFLQQLFQGASGVASSQAGRVGSAATGLADRLGGSGASFLNALQAFAGGNLGQGVEQATGGLLGLSSNPIAQQLSARLTSTALPGQSTLQALTGSPLTSAAAGGSVGAGLLEGLTGQLGAQLSGPNPGLQPSIDALGANIQEGLRGTLGTIASQATLQGATGGSRQALASGIAGGEAARAFASGAAGLIGQDFATRQALAPAILGQQVGAASALQQGELARAGLTDAASLASRDQALQAGSLLQSGSLAQAGGLSDLLGLVSGGLSAAGGLGVSGAQVGAGAAQAGIGGSGELFNLGLAPFGAEFSPYLALASILGGSTILSRSQSQSSSRGSGSGFSIGIPGE